VFINSPSSLKSTEELTIKIVGQIEKQIDVLKAFYHTNDEMIYQEIALYKVPTKALYESDTIEKVVRNSGARILEITRDYTVIEKTGHKEETQALFEELNKIEGYAVYTFGASSLNPRSD
jgi:acetolactate synthase I/III small subunit